MANISGILDGGGLSAQGKEGTTVQTFALSLAAGAVLFGVQFSAFAINRNYLWAKRIYQPRSFLVPLKDRIKPPPNNIFRWAATVYKIPSNTEVLHKAGMDAYFFLRYLTLGLKMFLPIAFVTLPILLPLNAVNGKGTSTNPIDGKSYNITGLDVLAWTNVTPQHTSRYWAHLVLAVLIIAWVCFLFYKELMHYVVKRQQFLGSPSHRLKASSTTVLITDVPPELCTTEALTELYDDFPGGIRRLWINKDYKNLSDKDESRRHFEDLLENAETNLIRNAVKKSRKSQKKVSSETTTAKATTTQNKEMHEAITRKTTLSGESNLIKVTPAECKKDLQHDVDTKATWTLYIDPKERQKMRIAKPHRKGAFKIPLIGRFFCEKVDTIYYCRRQLALLNEEMEQEIEQAESLPMSGSAFIQFNTQKAAHLACQAVADTVPRQMLQRTVEISPADINWSALQASWLNRAVRLVVFLVLLLVVTFVFGLISFFTGILSRLSTLAGSTSWLRWIASLPSWLLSFIQGTLPPVILVILLSGPTPIVLRAMTNKTRAAITGAQGERSLQNWYFIFLLLELFIIPTISSGLTSIVQEILHSPQSVPNILATYLPTASNYYFSFLIVQALSISASSICQTVRMFNYYVIGSVNTADALFAKLTFTHFTRIGSNIPWYTTFMVIGLVYSVIAPLISLFMILTFSLFWVVIKNNVLYVVRTGTIDSGGLWFPHAINQTFTGLYFMEFCLIGLFFLVRDTNDDVACSAQGVIMAICFVCTILYQIWLTKNFAGLVKFAPLRLETIAAQKDRDYELERLAPYSVDAEKASGQNADHSTNNTTVLSQSPERTDDLVLPLKKEVSAPNFNPDLHQHRRASTRSALIADRTQNLALQKAQDKAGATNVLARLNRPLDEARLLALESHLAATEARIGNVLLPRSKDIEARMLNDPISKVIMQHNDELEDLSAEERDMLVSVAFTHPVLRASRPTVWIPRDELGVSDDEVKRTREMEGGRWVEIDNRGAFFDKKLKVGIDRAPPDMSEFALVMAEL